MRFQNSKLNISNKKVSLLDYQHRLKKLVKRIKKITEVNNSKSSQMIA